MRGEREVMTDAGVSGCFVGCFCRRMSRIRYSLAAPHGTMTLYAGPGLALAYMRRGAVLDTREGIHVGVVQSRVECGNFRR